MKKKLLIVFLGLATQIGFGQTFTQSPDDVETQLSLGQNLLILDGPLVNSFGEEENVVTYGESGYNTVDLSTERFLARGFNFTMAPKWGNTNPIKFTKLKIPVYAASKGSSTAILISIAPAQMNKNLKIPVPVSFTNTVQLQVAVITPSGEPEVLFDENLSVVDGYLEIPFNTENIEFDTGTILRVRGFINGTLPSTHDVGFIFTPDEENVHNVHPIGSAYAISDWWDGPEVWDNMDDYAIWGTELNGQPKTLLNTLEKTAFPLSVGGTGAGYNGTAGWASVYSEEGLVVGKNHSGDALYLFNNGSSAGINRYNYTTNGPSTLNLKWGHPEDKILMLQNGGKAGIGKDPETTLDVNGEAAANTFTVGEIGASTLRLSSTPNHEHFFLRYEDESRSRNILEYKKEFDRTIFGDLSDGPNLTIYSEAEGTSNPSALLRNGSTQLWMFEDGIRIGTHGDGVNDDFSDFDIDVQGNMNVTDDVSINGSFIMNKAGSSRSYEMGMFKNEPKNQHNFSIRESESNMAFIEYNSEKSELWLGTGMHYEDHTSVYLFGDVGVIPSADYLEPDYVFEDDYDLMPLEEVETFIQAHKHLPNMKSAAEIEAQGSKKVLESLALLKEKVEELMLYTIEQEKKIKSLECQLKVKEDE